MKRWEYDSDTFTKKHEQVVAGNWDLVLMLRKRGEGGWEVIDFMREEYPGRNAKVYFYQIFYKRRNPKDPANS